MGKRNKGSSKSQRRVFQLDQERIKEADKQRDMRLMRHMLLMVGDLPLEEQHRLTFSCLRSLEVAMEREGVEVPKYVEHRVSQVKHDMNPNRVRCNRCEYNSKHSEDSMGVIGKCSVFCWSNGEPYLTGPDDGCSRGSLRKEYIK